MSENKQAPLVKWVTGRFRAPIERVECTRETEQSVFVMHGEQERRAAKHSTYEQYHDSWDAAHAHLVQRAQGEVDAYRSRLESAKGKLGNIKGMKKPSDA